jgi:hypothetical protein
MSRARRERRWPNVIGVFKLHNCMHTEPGVGSSVQIKRVEAEPAVPLPGIGHKAPSLETISHAEQYKMLRDEIMQSCHEIHRIEIWAAVAAGGIYAWALSNKERIPSRYVWFIVPFLLFVCALRCFELTAQIRRIAIYLRRIESAAFKNDAQLPGWETYRSKHRPMENLLDLTAGTFWALVFIVSVVLAVMLGNVSSPSRTTRPVGLSSNQSSAPTNMMPGATPLSISDIHPRAGQSNAVTPGSGFGFQVAPMDSASNQPTRPIGH